MKRILPLFLSLLLLSGCGAQETIPESAPASEPTATEALVEPAGLYDPGSALEQASGGALKAYPTGRTDTAAIVPFGDALLLFSGSDTTTLTRLSGDSLVPTAEFTLGFPISAADPAVQISGKGVTYYDAAQHDLVFLDANLKEVRRVDVPDTATGQPALSADRKTLYYFTSGALRALDLESGIDRLLREMSFAQQSITALHCGDTVLECSAGGEARQLFISVSTGALLHESAEPVTLTTAGEVWFALHQDGGYEEKLTGLGSGEVRMLHTPDHRASTFPFPEQNTVVTATSRDGQTTLDCYTLSDGTHPGSVTLPGGMELRGLTADPLRGCIWLLCYDDGYGCDVLCRWDTEKSPVQDDTVYISARRTVEDPDKYGLADCAQLADQLSSKYGVRILVWTDATAAQPGDYTLVPEYQVSLTQEALELLDRSLANFPEGFLKSAASGLGDGTLRIALVRDIAGKDGTENSGGLRFQSDEGNAYVCLEIGAGQEQQLYHELFHVIENRIFSLSSAFDNWDDLNPGNFEYDIRYGQAEFTVDAALTEGENRAFTDRRAMTYPTEDRAAIMEYAMMPGNEEVFRSPTMQAKLRCICKGIREAYGLKGSPEAFLWEQYLAAE